MVDLLIWLVAALGAVGGVVLGRVWGRMTGKRDGKREAERDAMAWSLSTRPGRALAALGGLVVARLTASRLGQVRGSA